MEKTTNPVLSYIIPCYNVEKYIDECLQSIYNQDIAEADFEVICIDDCSADNTFDKLKKFQESRQNLHVFRNDVNKKLSETRNIGFSLAKGKYVWFIDSDDFIEKNAAKKLINELENNDLDILNFNLCRYYSAREIEKITALSVETDVMCGADFLRNLQSITSNGSVCRKIFRKDFLVQTGLKFPKDMLYEDQFFSLSAVYQAKRFKYICQDIYYYRSSPNSILNSPMDAKKCLSVLYNVSEFLGFYEKITASDKEFAQRVKISALGDLDFIFKYIPAFTASQRRQAFGYIEKYLPVINQSGFFTGKKAKFFKNIKRAGLILTFTHPLYMLKRKAGRLKRTIFSIKK